MPIESSPITSQAGAGGFARRLLVSVSPHMKADITVARIMWTVIACLIPPLLLSVWVFGFQTLIITAVSVISCVATEAISEKILKRPITIKDGSAVITGILLAYVIPPGVPLWMPVFGAVMAIFVTKILMGGLGHNIFNPALIGRAFLMATYPVAMTTAWLEPLRNWSVFRNMKSGVDAISSATPLYILKHYGMAELLERFGSRGSMYTDFFTGTMPGCIGETSALLLVIGGVYLIYKGYINWQIPVSVIVTTGGLTWLFGGERLCTGDPILAVLSGGLMLGAFFMATDYVTSPSHRTGQIVFGVGVGALTVLIRLKGGYPEGVCYAILLMNPLAPAIDQIFKPKRFSQGAAR